MRTFTYSLAALLIAAIAACSPSTSSTSEKKITDSTAVSSKNADTSLTAIIKMQQTAVLGTPLEMTFTVYNLTDSARAFCKWHTPFEPLMSKYLDVSSATGEEIAYKGPMAKRIMPPPANSYVWIKPGDSLSTKVDLLKAYDLKAAGNYSIRYNSEAISGLKVQDTIQLILK